MQTIQLQIEDNIYDSIVKSGIDIQDELKKALKKIIYKKEYKIADEINKAIAEVKTNKTKPLSEVLGAV